MKANKTIVVGLDGAHFELIDPWLAGGDLPNIKKIVDIGVKADMLSCLPPVTSPNWKCYSTGMNPGKLGIFWWENIDVKNRKVYYPKERKNLSKEIWDYLSEAGFKVLVIGTPLTYPPKRVNGMMISGGLDAEEEHFTYPADLEAELKKKYHYQVRTTFNLETEKEKAVAEIYHLINQRFQVALDLLKKENFDFIQVTTFYLNALQHFFWNGEETKKAWKIIDRYIGEFLKLPETNLILMSDHGSNKIETVFNVNTWFHREGYLKYRTSLWLLKYVSKLGLSKSNLVKIINLFRLNFLVEQVRKILPKEIFENLPLASGEVNKSGKATTIDWENSTAVASGQGPVYLLNKSKKDEIKKKLKELKGIDGQRVVNEVYDREEIYSGKYLNEAPDLIIDQAEHVHIKGNIGSQQIFEPPKRWRAENKKYGLFLAIGPDFCFKIERPIKILDLAPTILSIFDLNKPADMDGSTFSDG